MKKTKSNLEDFEWQLKHYAHIIQLYWTLSRRLVFKWQVTLHHGHRGGNTIEVTHCTVSFGLGLVHSSLQHFTYKMTQSNAHSIRWHGAVLRVIPNWWTFENHKKEFRQNNKSKRLWFKSYSHVLIIIIIFILINKK